jgi:hypothetical protein
MDCCCCFCSLFVFLHVMSAIDFLLLMAITMVVVLLWVSFLWCVVFMR